jgi:hypothetical protein
VAEGGVSTMETSEDRCQASSRAEWLEILTSSLSSGLPPQARDRAAAVKRDCRARRSSQFVAPADLLCLPCSAALRFGVRATLAFDNEPGASRWRYVFRLLKSFLKLGYTRPRKA